MDTFLCNLINKPKFLEFGTSELISISQVFGVQPSKLFSSYSFPRPLSDLDYSEYFTPQVKSLPFLKVSLPRNHIPAEIARRSVCVNRFTKTLSEGESTADLLENIRVKFEQDQELQSIITENTPFAFKFDTYKVTVSQEAKESIIKQFEVLPFQGPVDLKNPSRIFIVTVTSNYCYFGLEIGRAKEKRSRFYSKYSLSDREYLGPTTTDLELSFLMVNQACVTEDSLVYDPFVGTGSILLAASHFRSTCFGGDLDIRVLKGYAVGRSTKGTPADIFSNFRNYGFAMPEILRCDNAKPCLKNTDIFDAIVCDPPYGVRARARKATQKGSKEIIQTEQYDGKGVVSDLLIMAANMLRPGGRLVYLLPCERNEYDPLKVPRHPMLEIVANSENVLSNKISRRLITMVKRERPVEGDDDMTGEFYTEIRQNWFSNRHSKDQS